MFLCLQLIVIILVNARAAARAQARPAVLDELDAFEEQYHATTVTAQPIDEGHVALFDDAAHRGHKWYDDPSRTKESSSVHEQHTSSIESTDDSLQHENDGSSEASSIETDEKHFQFRAYRECTPCVEDMMKQYTNKGIRWVCGMYQRARRSFKSECMMRYRNCQDGTMFVKVYDHKCKNDTRHGKHWFYIYHV